MNSSKAFRVDWYPRDSFIDFSRLDAEEIGVLMQIINLIYSHNRAVENDPKFIGKTCNITRSRCARIIERLLIKEEIYLNDEGKIHKKRCKEALKEIEKRREQYSKSGKKGSEIRWGVEQNQIDRGEEAISRTKASTNTRTLKETNIKTHTNYDIERHLTDRDRQAFKDQCQGYDIHFYIREFNADINSGKRSPPSRSHTGAFLKWSQIYAQNNPI